MTVRMQESEAAANFSRFLAHLEAGDEVDVEREGRPVLIAKADLIESGAIPARGSVEATQAFFEKRGSLLASEEHVRAMQKAREIYNQPLEPRPGWE